MKERVIRFTLPLFWIAGIGYFALVGGLSALVLMQDGDSVGRALPDGYYMLARAHYVLSIAAVYSFFAAWYYFFPKITGLRYHELIGQIHFWVTMVGTVLVFFSGHVLAIGGMPRRIADYPATYGMWSFVSRVGADISKIGILVFVTGVVVALVLKKKAVDL